MSKSNTWIKSNLWDRDLELGQKFGISIGDKVLPDYSPEDATNESLKDKPIYLLAKKLFDCAINETQFNETDDIFKDYHVTLVGRKVIDRSTKRFHEDFAKVTPNALSAEALQLRQVIVSMSESIDISNLWGKELKLSQHFGTSGCESIPDYSADETVIGHFLSKFVLVVTPHEEKCDAILKKELGGYSNHKLLNQDFQWGYFLDKMMNWFKKKREEGKDSWITSEEGVQILKKSDFLLDCIQIDGNSLKYRKKISNILEFHQDEIEKMKLKLEEFLRQSNDRNYYEIQSPSSVLISANKVISALKTMDKYKADDSFLVVFAHLLQEDKRWGKAFLEADGFHHLLVVICKKGTKEELDFVSKIQLPNTGEKKLLIVRKLNNNIDDENVYKDAELAYEQLSDATKVDLQSKTISFQGVEMSLRDLIADGNDGQNLVFDSNSLVELLLNKNEIVIPTHDFLQEHQLEKPNYIERQIQWILRSNSDKFWTNVAHNLNSMQDSTVKKLQEECQWDKITRKIKESMEDNNEEVTDIWKKILDTICETNKSEFENPSYIQSNVKRWVGPEDENTENFWTKVAKKLNSTVEELKEECQWEVEIDVKCMEEKLKEKCEWDEISRKIKWSVEDKKQIAIIWKAIYKTICEMNKSEFENPLYIKREMRRFVLPEDNKPSIKDEDTGDKNTTGEESQDTEEFWAKVAKRLSTKEKKCTVSQLKSELKRDETSSRIKWMVKDDTRKSNIIRAISEINSGNKPNFSKFNESELVTESETKYLQDQSIEESQAVEELKNSEVIVISGVAGTGKSSILSQLYENIKLTKSNQWVIKVNLINHCEVIKELKPQQLLNVIQFFIENWGKFILGNSQFAQWLFTERLKKTGNVTFMFDGFDEIGTELQKNTIELIKALRQTKADVIYVTTRSHMNETLETNFHQFVFSLQNFTDNDQIKFITNYWKENLDVGNLAEFLADEILKKCSKNKEIKEEGLIIKLVNYLNKTSKNVNDEEINERIKKLATFLAEQILKEIEGKKLGKDELTKLLVFKLPKILKDEIDKKRSDIEKMAEKLIDKISKDLNEKENEFVGIPLQCRILAECFQPQLTDALHIEQCRDSLDKEINGFTFDLVKLYERLMGKKQQIYCEEKIKTNLTTESLVESSVRERIEFLRQLAIDTIVESKEDAAILLGHSRKPHFESHAGKKEREILNADLGLSFGLLTKTSQGELEFLHRTYAEYLVADYIYQGFHLDDNNHNNLLNSKNVRNLLVRKIFKNDLYEGVMRFFNCMLKSFVDCDNWRRLIEKNDEGKDDLPKRWKLMVECIYNVEKDEDDESETTLLYLAMRRNFASFFIFICDCLVHFIYPNLKKLTSAFELKFKECIHWLLYYENEEKTSSVMFQKLLSIYEASPRDICSRIFNLMRENMRNSLKSRNYKNLSSCWNNEEKRKMIKLALEFLTKHKFIPENPIDGTYPIVKFFFRNGYYDEIITSLLDYLLLFENDTITAEILQLAFRRYSCRRHWEKGRNEFMLKRIVGFFKTKRWSDLIKGLHREILVLGDEESKREILLSTNAATPFYVAAACGYENDCRKILKQQENYSDSKPFLLKALGDAILFKNIEMFRLTFEAIKQIFSLSDLEDLLQSDIFDFVECYKSKSKRRENATVFVVIDDEELFNKMIGIFVGNRESLDSEQRKRINKLFLQNKETSDKIILLNEKHRRFLFPTDKFEDWLNYVMNVNIYIGFRLITKFLINIPDHLELLKIITQTDGNQSGSSYWNQWFEKDSKLDDWDRLNNLGELLVGISNSLGVGKMTEKLLLHDDGYAIACGLHRNRWAVKRAFDSVPNLKDEFAKKWMQHLPGVLERVSSRFRFFGSLNFILPMMTYARDDQLSKFVNVILEKDIWYWYITKRTDGLEIPDQFLKLVSKKLGNSELEKLVFHRFDETLAKIVRYRPQCHNLIDMLLSHIKGNHREKIGQELIKLPHHFDGRSAERYMKIFPILVKYSDEKHLKKFVDNIITRNTFERKEEGFKREERRRMVEYESSIWSEYLCSRYNLRKKEPDADLVASFLKWTSENLGNDYVEKLIRHEDGRLITRVLLFRKENIVNAVLNHLPIEFYTKIATFFMKNALGEFQDPDQDPKNKILRRYRRNDINTLFLPFLKEHAESQELVKFFNDTITQERNSVTDYRRKSIWIDYLRICVKKQEMDKVEEFFGFLSQNVEANKVCDWMCAFIGDLAKFALDGNDDKFVKLMINELRSNDYKKFWHRLIEYQLKWKIRKENWFYLLPLLQHNRDTNQLGKLIEIITHRCDQKTEMTKWSIWSYYIDHDDRCTSVTIDKLLDCVHATKEFGPSKVKELVLHSPNEGDDDPVVVRAAFNGETDVVEAMLRYLSIEDRKEVEQQIEAALNLEK